MNFCGSRKGRKAQQDHDNILHLRRRIRAFYMSSDAPRERGPKSVIRRLILKMFMPSKDGQIPRLKANAAESRHL
eukprot:2832958-Pyramimonas_sp.AAC.1